jgi:hypothetical protein
MKTSLHLIVLLYFVTSAALAQRRVVPSSGGLLEGDPTQMTPLQQMQANQANQQWQQQQIVAAAQKSAAQAAAYAKQAADSAAQAAAYNNEQSKQTAEYAAAAANDAERAKMAARSNMRDGSIFLEQAALAKQAADSAAQEARQAEISLAGAKLENERDESVATLKSKYSSSIAELEAQAAIAKQKIQQLGQKASELEGQRSQSEAENAHLRAKQLFQPKDPWRKLDGKVCNAKDESWFLFTGKILEVRPNGILVDGDFGPPLEAGFGERVFFVENFPAQTYPFADGEAITATMNLVAHMSEKASTYQFTNTTIDLRVNTVRRLDYGNIVTSPPPDLAQKWNNILIGGSENSEVAKALADNQEQQAEAKKELTAIESKLAQISSDFDKEKQPIIAEYEAKIKDVPNVVAREVKAKEDAKKQAITDKVLKNNQDLADKGDAYGLLRMGQRYRDGEGVEKDLTKARDYLTKAAAAGSQTADDELKKLPASQN